MSERPITLTIAALGGQGGGVLAEWLIDTSPHILVPSALTEDELIACDVDQESSQPSRDRAEVARAVRDRLERFARGEV